MKLGNVIASLRVRKRLDQKAMAEKLGVSVSYLSQIENNNRMPSGKLLIKISETLGLPISVLLYETLNASNIVDENNRKLFINIPLGKFQ